MIENKLISLDDVISGESYFKCEFQYSNGNIMLDEIMFDNCTFQQEDFSLADILDCTFINCDLSNYIFNESNIYRTTFKNSRLLGTSWIGSNLKEFSIDACQADLSNFSDASINKASFSNSTFKEAYFQSVSFKNTIKFDKCNIEAIDLMGTKLKNVRVDSSQFDTIIFSPELMAGFQINSQQGVVILSALGLKVKG